MTDPTRYLTIWIGPSSYVDAAGVRHDVPRHLIGISTPYVRDQRKGSASKFSTSNEDAKPAGERPPRGLSDKQRLEDVKFWLQVIAVLVFVIVPGVQPMSEATRYPLAWPAGWVRTKTRRVAMFSKRPRWTTTDGQAGWRRAALTVGDGLTRLVGELRRLGARRIVISSNLRTNLDGTITAKQAKQLDDPGVAVYFYLHDAPRVLACDRWTSAADNMAAIAAHIEAIRAQDRYGVGTLDQAFAGYAALPPVGGSQGGDWRAELGLGADPRDELTLTHVENRYRALLKERHPDHGGSHDAVIRLNLARDAARAYFKDHP